MSLSLAQLSLVQLSLVQFRLVQLRLVQLRLVQQNLYVSLRNSIEEIARDAYGQILLEEPSAPHIQIRHGEVHLRPERGAGGYEQIPLEEPSAPHTQIRRDEAHLRRNDPRDLVGDDRERILNLALIL